MVDLRNYANPTNAQQSAEWITAGYIRPNKKGEIGAMVNVEMYVTFTPEGNMVLPLGDNKFVEIPPVVGKKNATYNVGKTGLSVSLTHIADVLSGKDGAYAAINSPPRLERTTPPAEATTEQPATAATTEEPSPASPKSSSRSKKTTLDNLKGE
ncbi:hypothetical protein [Bacteroides sp.]|uniref:hypothetical protein n=1 Tax=Bacteroides sp. TaxID=29523 RepID=UPI00262B93C0|nr:hypothetical protein [Bacteroides sp.]MDD3039051.1 hypothetical protein [Bacteroides sp.]